MQVSLLPTGLIGKIRAPNYYSWTIRLDISCSLIENLWFIFNLNNSLGSVAMDWELW